MDESQPRVVLGQHDSHAVGPLPSAWGLTTALLSLSYPVEDHCPLRSAYSPGNYLLINFSDI